MTQRRSDQETTMKYELMFNSSAHERYYTDMNKRVRDHIEQAGVRLFGESGGTRLDVPADDPRASDNVFSVECDEVTAQRLTHEISRLLDNRAVYMEKVEADD